MNDSTQQSNAAPQSRRAIEGQIEETRSRLEHNLSELENRLEPRQLANDAFDYVRYSGASDFAANLGNSVRDNPLPVVLTSVGVGWLMWSQRGGATANQLESSDDQGRSRTAEAGAKAQDMADRAKRGAQNAKQGLAQRKRSAKESAQNASGATRDTAQAASERAQALSERTRSAGNQTVSLIADNPLAAGAIGIGLGALLGGLIPATRTENQQLGGLRDDAVEHARQTGLEQVDRARAGLHEQAEQARDGERPSDSGAGAGSGTDRQRQTQTATASQKPEVAPSSAATSGHPGNRRS